MESSTPTAQTAERSDQKAPDAPPASEHASPASPPAALALGPVIVDVAGRHLEAVDRARLLHPLVGGVILFARNFESKRQVTELCREIHALRSPRLPIFVDHEGGRVQRFSKGFTEIPPMRDLGAMWDYDVLGACKRATEFGQIIGRELREVGVELSFTPVLDIDYGRSAVIGDRALHPDPRTVAMLSRCLMHGLLLSGMGNCGKHFPGHGYAAADSHLALPTDDRDLDTLLAADAAPYDWLGDTLLAVMPAHIVYPKVDSKPAGFSRIWLQELLRKRLGFNGLIFSDDLAMEGAAVAGNVVQRAKAALSAGCDMVLICNQPALADELLAKLKWKAPAAFQGRLDRLLRRAA